MATLHLLFSRSGLGSCLEVATSEDQLLLIENGVYAVLEHRDIPLLAIADDLIARGLADWPTNNVRAVSYRDMVDLVVAHQPVVSWR